ncbi:MAG TPA: nucleotidyltransferase domain-containing protein, partial [Methylomirabilota bacterium]|nr:nucleotidyltransferase domain-containing protein [Methylomirabilota bacterium]
LEEYGISYAGVFGSVAQGKAKEDSDVDLIVRFGRPMGMFTYMKFVNGLETSLKRKVDVVTENSLNKFVKPYVLPEIKVIYEE